ncbi:DUF2460 domain-containing protein [Candidatus Cyrtobacter comes]|uniref:DUF2460 domain-containing protein n=2 Tax=Candidatus Cyrtobacter comes TaxID=675776 RepID=A0ABU5L7N4_9RICK|nr:DUF2460 domain-containing protein [Candidatus Cyrtobacter comes]
MKQIVNFIEERFPEDISYGSLGGPEYINNVIESLNFNEIRMPKCTNSRMRYNIMPGIKNQEQLDILISFFRICRGKLIGFRYKDWSDYKAKEEKLAICKGVETEFQLTKSYAIGNYTYVRKINKPVRNTVKILINNRVLENYDILKIDYSTGIFSFITPLLKGDVISAEFEFDVPVRFDTDYMPITMEGNNIYSCYNLNLVEIMQN